MIKLPQQDARTLIAVHGWSGILLGMLLYVVICTGVAAVFAEEISDWSSPLAHPVRAVAIPAGIDAVVKDLAGKVDPKYHEQIAISRAAGGRIEAFYHHDAIDPTGTKSEEGVEFELDPATWQVLATRSGWEDQIEADRRSSGIADFFVNLHVRLHIPEPYGFIVTGILGLAMMVAAVTALLIHRHLIADLFTLRLGRDVLLRRRDLHVVAGSWNLPFALLLAFTGSFFSLATSIGLPAIAMVKFGGDEDALIETLYGTARKEDSRPASITNMETLLGRTRTRQRAEPDFISIEHYGRADATIAVSTALPQNTLVYASDLYDGVTGALIRLQPPLGKIPSVGASLVGLMYPLHFGNFAGAASKAVWVALGAGAGYVALSGMLLWMRRRQEQAAWRPLARLVHVIGYGLPLALACAPYAFFLLRAQTIQAGRAQDAAFVTVALLVLALSFAIRDLERLRRCLLAATGFTLLGLPVVRLATDGMGWMQSWQLGIHAVPAVDTALVAIGCACVWSALAGARRA